MRIAFVSLMAGSPWAASEVLWAQTAQRALETGHDVFVSSYGWPQRPQAIADLVHLGAHAGTRPLTRWIRRSTIATRLVQTFQPLERFKPDVVCVSQGGTYDIARSGSTAVLRQTLRRLRAPYVVLCHCEQPAPPPRIVHKARTVFSQAAIIGFVGQRAWSVTESHLDMTLANARIFHNPVNLHPIAYVPWPQESSPLRLAFVGRLEPVKNLEGLLTALAEERWSQREWTLTIFGSGSLRSELEKYVVRHNLAARCSFAGHVADIGHVWRDCHALVLPSRFEGVPLALIEASLCGRPAVATNTGGIAEWIQDGETGFLIHDPTAASIAQALERLWEHRGELEALGLRAHSRTLEKRDPDPAGTLLGWLTAAEGQDGNKGNRFSLTDRRPTSQDDTRPDS